MFDINYFSCSVMSIKPDQNKLNVIPCAFSHSHLIPAELLLLLLGQPEKEVKRNGGKRVSKSRKDHQGRICLLVCACVCVCYGESLPGQNEEG